MAATIKVVLEGMRNIREQGTRDTMSTLASMAVLFENQLLSCRKGPVTRMQTCGVEEEERALEYHKYAHANVSAASLLLNCCHIDAHHPEHRQQWVTHKARTLSVSKNYLAKLPLNSPR